MRTLKEWPDPEDYVVCTISELNPNSAVVVLDEYEGKKGMVHVSEVANTMVRDIRRFVKIGEKEIAKVLFVDPQRGYVGLSLKRVKPSIRREKILEFKNEKKAEKFLNFAAKEMKKTITDAYEKAGYPLMEKYGGLLYPAFECAKTGGKDALINDGVPTDWAAAIADIAEKNIKEKEVVKTLILSLESFAPNGVVAIKNALEIKDKKGVEIKYVSAPKFKLTVSGPDYPAVEARIAKIIKNAEEIMKKAGGEVKVEEVAAQ
ncbi:MAG: S1 RNA-binding domain-containing protein [Nanoarchaeota archaeon]|nr:S1 RNA-binding domain-containing protein [Nanoarchaeota archaeon]MBU4300990.1 S1 RNA-binding domain-containing protein [Nanoarchaeota archaeon]MBU4452441.1 S1 RNA-binding domain-containing protein [Nanoarchaeota archaeon]MCG2723971.1 S1 RNA-binding domain-containing protein [archaeon]